LAPGKKYILAPFLAFGNPTIKKGAENITPQKILLKILP
jgi:hypothetical protein